MMIDPYGVKDKKKQRVWWQRLRLDFRVFTHLFPWRIAGLFAFTFLLISFGFQQAYLRTFSIQSAEFSYVKALYAILNMSTFQISFADIPPGPSLDIYFILVPLMTIPFLLMFGLNLIQIIRVFFVRQERGQMWQKALAATIPEPIVICGLGRVGYRIAKQLHAAGYPVIGIEAVQTPLVETLMDSDMPVIIGDIRNIDVLQDASIPRAKHVLVCTHDDLTNITAANYVREMNAHAELTLRLFDDEISDQLKRAFNVKTSISRSAVAAQAFAYAALGLEVLETFYLHTKTYVLAEIPIDHQREIPHTLLDFTKDKAMTVACIYRDKSFIIEPHEKTILMENDNLIVFTELENLTQFHSNKCLSRAHVIVCGIGHTGYRVTLALRALGQTVYAVDYETNSLTERLHAEGIRVILGDYRQMSILEEAGIGEARALIACSEDDMVNVETVLKARERIPSIRIIARIFEESLGRRLQHIFGIDAAYSTSELAAPEFVTATVNVHLTQSINLGSDDFFIARLHVNQNSMMNNKQIKEINRLPESTVLLHCIGDHIQIPPSPDAVISIGDEIVVLTSRQELNNLRFQ